ncbi:MAG: Alginateexp domain-containing protein [Nitrospira sp.]|nr:MAG: Alginateexp domain-containing protein [Nitrospira sp.]
MRRSKDATKWVLAAALLVAMPIGLALADPPVAPTVIDRPMHGVPVPRGMPDLIPYWSFDPPKSPLFDISKFTLSGDARIRGESRTNPNFAASKADTFIQQWARLGLNYAISQDVDVFTQIQYSKNWGGASTNAGLANDSSSQTGNTNGSVLGVRQAFIMIRNLGVDGLSLKVGRQLVVMGNHRLFGHFDWNNQAFSHDGITFQYNQPMYEVWGGWLHAGNSDAVAAGASAGAVANAATGGGQNADILFTRVAFKPIAGLAIEPLWVWQNNKTGSSPAGGLGVTPLAPGANGILAAHAPGQSRHTLGGRVAYRQGLFDGTAEAYWQTGHFELSNGQNLSINAVAMAVEGGITLKDVPTTPRLGAEFNYASGDGDGKACAQNGQAACNGNANTFENLYPTNHIVMGYADRMAWRNMVGYSGSLQLNPTQQTHLESRFWVFRKANNGDCWYTASQACQGVGGTTNNSLYKELDLIFTMFFKNNKVAWQTGGAYLWASGGMDQMVNAQGNAVAQGGARNSTWMYSQLQVNF